MQMDYFKRNYSEQLVEYASFVVSKEITKRINYFLFPWLAFLHVRMTNGYCFCSLHFLKYFSSTLKCFSSPEISFPNHNRAKKKWSKTQSIILSLLPWLGKNTNQKPRCVSTVLIMPLWEEVSFMMLSRKT